MVDWIVLRRLLIPGLRLIKKWTEQQMSFSAHRECIFDIQDRLPPRSVVEKYLSLVSEFKKVMRL